MRLVLCYNGLMRLSADARDRLVAVGSLTMRNLDISGSLARKRYSPTDVTPKEVLISKDQIFWTGRQCLIV